MEAAAGEPSSAKMAPEDVQQDPPPCPVSNIMPPPDEPQTRAEFLKYYCHLTLDPNTVYKELRLSEGNRKVELTDSVQTYPDHPDRFSHIFQVLCNQGLSGRCYWEVEFEGSTEIAVTYEDLGRSGYFDECAFGCNDKSWSLDLNKNHECFRHNDVETAVPEPQSSRVGVYLDHKAGILTYYCVCGTMLQPMHRVKTTFTQLLYPGLWVAGSARLCDPE